MERQRGPGFAPSLYQRLLPDKRRPQEREASSEIHTIVRVLPLAMVKPETLLMSEENSVADTWFTRSYWLVKGRKAVNPYQVMLPGGGLKKEEAQVEGGARELFEEMAIAGAKITDKPLSSDRQYAFDHRKGRRKNRETTYAGEVPPFLHPRAFDPVDRVSRILELDIQELQEFLESERIDALDRTCQLVENLQVAPPKSVEVNRDETLELRGQLLLEAYRYEIGIKQRIIERVLENHGYHWDPDLFQRPAINDLDQAQATMRVFSEIIENQFGINPGEPLSQEARVGLQVAAEEVYLEESLKFIEDSGPQKSYLLGQIILDLSTITPFELALIQQNSPELAAIFNTVINTFGINIDFNLPGAYEQLIDVMRQWRDSKVALDEQYNTMDGAIKKAYSDATGVDEVKFPRNADHANKFFVSLQQALYPKVTAEVAQQLFFDNHLVGTDNLDELLYVAFGMRPYGGELDADQKHIRWQALAKLITIAKIGAIEEARNADVHRSRFRFRTAWDTLIERKYKTGVFLDRRKEFPMNKARVDLNGSGAVDVFYSFREKSIESYLRKVLERGAEGGQNVKDTFGIEVILDTNGPFGSQMVRGLTKKQRDVIGSERRSTTKAFLGKLCEHLAHVGFNSEQPPHNMKDNGILAGIISETFSISSADHVGSIASFPQWSWAKFVAAIEGSDGRNVFCEFQIYPSVADFKAKKRDDKESYDSRRLFLLPRPGRFPVFDLFFRVNNELYNQVKTASYT